MRIAGTGSALPKQIITNDDLTAFLDTSDEWISTRTGIKQRRILSTETLEDLAAEAAKKAIDKAGIVAEELDYIICSTVYNDYFTPALSCIVQGMIGACCPCVDINGACAGFVYALQIAQGFFNSGMQNILVFCAEETTKMVDWNDRATCVLFGDGAAAVVLQAGGQDAKFKMYTQSDPQIIYGIRQQGNCPYTPSKKEASFMHMQGQEVYKFAVARASGDILSVLEENDKTPQEIKHYLLHQANQRIIDGIRKRVKAPKSAFASNIAFYGNTSSASIPILLDEMCEAGAFSPGDELIFSAFGAGLVTGTCLLTW